jgi:hypothetical protein
MLAYDRCATAMAQTTLIGGLGLAVFATSTFTPTQQFGYLMITMLATALVGDLLLLPALLASPLGYFFSGNAPKGSEATAKDPEENIEWGTGGQESEDPWPSPHDNTPTGIPVTIDPRPESDTAPNRAAASLSEEAATDSSQSRSESPHAALHAKLQNLRRKHPNDSLPSP